MERSRLRRALIILVGAAVAAVLSMSPASADDTVVVRGLGFPATGMTNLSIVGCSGLYDRVPEPIPTFLSRSADAPAGSRSLKFDLAGGNAVGSQHRFGSLASTTVAGLSLSAPEGAAGVAYVGYRAPADWATNLVWVGRAPLDEAAGGWRPVDVAGLTYTWTQYDLSTQQPVASADAPATVPDFMAAMGGDGPGFFTVGFGCDGRPFKIDALRIGSPGEVTTYDLEGFTSITDIAAPTNTIVAGDSLTIDGTLSSSSGAPLDARLLVLEAQEFGKSSFVPVDGADVQAGHASLAVHPLARTVYRWRFVGSSSTEASISSPIVVDVAPVVTAESVAGDAPESVVVRGALTPVKAGVRVTLWRVTGKRPVPVGTAVTGADGTYRIPVKSGVSGAWRSFVTVPATSGNLAGQSTLLAVTTSGSTR